MDPKETQEEEIQVLLSIYEGDDNFKQISSCCFQYKCKEEEKEDGKAFLVEITWPETYPEDLPSINLDIFYNSRLSKALKEDIKKELLDQAKILKGEPMTYTLFDWLRENGQQFIEKIPDVLVAQVEEEKLNGEVEVKVKKEKKEQLSKAQKRKLADQFNVRGERERGWNWVDVVKHLSQTGSQTQAAS